MKIHKEGSSIIIIVFGLLALANLFLLQNHVPPVILYTFAGASLIFLLCIVSFFRIPRRVFTFDSQAIIAPADGKIVVIEEVVEEEFLKKPCRQISIFMSPANVHVNRYPCNGEILASVHHDGAKYPAFNPKSSTLNERTSIYMRSDFGAEILFRQVAGAMARRIVNYASVGMQVKQNEEFGFIKFGSRVDIFLPLDMEVCVNLCEPVRGGQTVLAKKTQEI
ncbi:MAG: phosphatidylserine decarboxylase family protein [Bacteroidales bacterium]|jgi:phosphatidylserine decarboxylase|nr:phosphatidylserine decarboxylase family protein [Bacteroidales bacterium]